MIIVKLIGGLGNQLFQYACGRYLAHLHKTELYLDLSFLEKPSDGSYTQRKYELAPYHLNIAFANAEMIQKFNPGNRLTRTLQRKLPILFDHLYVSESGSAYHKEFMSYPADTYLDGFWQSELYFKPIENLLRNELTLNTELNKENQFWLNKINSCESIALHVRRGDYVQNKLANAFHGICSPEYYHAAISWMDKEVKASEVFVFSDDIDWCKAEFKEKNFHFVDVNSAEQAHFDLMLMQHCKHAIIANSSFSWWAAWLNSNPDKKIVAPLHWFKDPSMHNPDLIPSTWKQV